MNLNNTKFETLQGEPAKITQALNEFKLLCNNILVLHCAMGMDQFQRPVFIMLVQLEFKGTGSVKEYEDKYNKPAMTLTN